MAVLLDANGDYLTRTASVLDYNSAYTVMCWAYVTNTSLEQYPAFISITNNVGDGTGGYDYLGTTQNGDYLSIGSQAAQVEDTGGTQFPNGTWVHVALVRPDTSSLLGYVNGALRITASSSGIGARGASGRMSAGKFDDVYSQLGGRLYAMKAWQGALSAAEIAQEYQTIRPTRFADLWGWWPLLPGSGERTRDYAASGRDWTEAGTLSDAQEPPLSWGASHVYYSLPSASEGNDYTLEAGAGSVTLTGTAATPRLTLPATSGAASLTGTAATLRMTRLLPSAPGSVNSTGTALTPIVRLPADSGAFALTGTAAHLRYPRLVVGAAGSVSLTGTALTPKVRLPATGGSLLTTGTAAALLYSGFTTVPADYLPLFRRRRR